MDTPHPFSPDHLRSPDYLTPLLARLDRAVRRVVRSADAEDAVQEAWCVLYSDLDAIVAVATDGGTTTDPDQITDRLVGFLLTTATRRARDQQRKHRPESMDAGILAERALCEPSQGAMFDQRELGTAWRDELAAFRAKLDPVNRGIFDAYLDDLSHEEVAEVFGLPGANASTQRMKRIRAALQTERNAALAKGLQAAREANYAGGDGSLTATLVGPDGESEFDIEAPQARWHADGYLRVDLTLSTDPGVPNMVGIALLQPSDRLAPAPTAPFVLRWEPAGATFRARLEAFLGKPPFHDLSGDGVQWPLDRLELALAS